MPNLVNRTVETLRFEQPCSPLRAKVPRHYEALVGEAEREGRYISQKLLTHGDLTIFLTVIYDSIQYLPCLVSGCHIKFWNESRKCLNNKLKN